jgi:4-carboxymuconolactone decarboxylase
MPKGEKVNDDRYARGKEVLGRLDPAAFERFQAAIGSVAPNFARYVIEAEYGTFYADETLSLRDRELVLCVALAAKGSDPAHLRAHVLQGMRAGLEKEEIVSALSTVSLAAGLPAAVDALLVADEAFSEYEGG